MKRLALVCCLLATPALAQPDTAPQVVKTEDTINLSVGQATKLVFPGVFDQIHLTSDTVVQAKPVTDKMLTLQGLAEGEAIMTVMAGTREVWSGTIVVGAERGHTVRMYDGKSKDYLGFYCTDSILRPGRQGTQRCP
jgi:Flp pilus assembly secretin CpaC